jgi:hypothetical protein
MTPRTSRLRRNPVVFWTFALLVGLSGTVAKADPLYTVTNLGSTSDISFTTAGGGTISWPTNNLAANQLGGVSNGQVSYAFATMPDTVLVQGQGALTNVPANLDSFPSQFQFAGPEVSGLSNANGFAALVVSLPVVNLSAAYDTAAIYPIGSNGQVDWSQGATITSSPNSEVNGGGIGIAGINAASQVLLGTSFAGAESDSLVYNLATRSLTDLDSLPAILAAGYTNLRPIAIDNQGQILVTAIPADSPGAAVTLLLTPNGEPIVTAPEPSTCITWALIAGASWLAAKRRRG